MSTEEFWMGEFGNAYTERNRVDWIKRALFWRDILGITGVRDVIEIGCNAGWNLSALKLARPDINCTGVEINKRARKEAENAGFVVYDDINQAVHATDSYLWYDVHAPHLAFTCGVLIHIDEENISAFMDKIINLSKNYVLFIEYTADQTEMVTYRGHANKLWRRNYQSLYENKGLTAITGGHLTSEEGFDECGWALLRK